MKHIFILVANTRWSDQVVGRRETKTSIQLDNEKPFIPWMKLEIELESQYFFLLLGNVH